MTDNVLADFFARLGFKVDEAGQKKFHAGLETLQKRAAEATISLQKLSKAFLTLEALKTATEGVGSLASSFERLYYASRRTGSSAGELKAFGFAISQLGGSADAAMASLEGLAEKIRSNPKGYAGYLQRFGISNPSDVAKSVEQMRRSLQTMPYYRAKAYAEDLGLDERSLQALIDPAFEDFLKTYKEKMRAAGLDPETASASGKRLAQQWRNLSASLDVLVEKAVSKLFPESGDNPLTRLTNWIDQNSDRITNVIDEIAKAVIKFAAQVATFVQSDTFAQFFHAFTDIKKWQEFAAALEWVGTKIERIFKSIDGFMKTPAGKFVMGKWGFGVTDDYAPPPEKEIAPDANDRDPFGIFGGMKRAWQNRPWRRRSDASDTTGSVSNAAGSGNLTKLTEDAAREAGINPRIMHGIRAGESGHRSNYDVGDIGNGPAYGPWQLNVGPGRLGDKFQRETGLDLRDPSTIPSQTRWVARYIAGRLKANPNYSPGGEWFGYHGNRDADPRWGDSGYVPAPMKIAPMAREGYMPRHDGSSVPIPKIAPLPGSTPYGGFDADALRRSIDVQPPPASTSSIQHNDHSVTDNKKVSIIVNGAHDPQKTAMTLDGVFNRNRLFQTRSAATALV